MTTGLVSLHYHVDGRRGQRSIISEGAWGAITEQENNA